MIPWGLLGRKVITRPCSTLSHIIYKKVKSMTMTNANKRGQVALAYMALGTHGGIQLPTASDAHHQLADRSKSVVPLHLPTAAD
jgi:hypothetical protein